MLLIQSTLKSVQIECRLLSPSGRKSIENETKKSHLPAHGGGRWLLGVHRPSTPVIKPLTRVIPVAKRRPVVITGVALVRGAVARIRIVAVGRVAVVAVTVEIAGGVVTAASPVI